MKIALKIDVDTYRGTREGVPKLVDILKRHNAGATFLFSLGPDHTGRAIKRAFRPGFMKKVSRTSVLEHYGIVTLLYGTLLPGPDIGVRCADILRSVRDAGFETGIHTWDHVKWQDGVRHADGRWTREQMQLACDRYQQVFGERARVHGAAGWQMNRHSYRLTQQFGFDYCSDTRGNAPFIPIVNAEIVACPQLPTTLPTLDELIGVDEITVDNVAESVCRAGAVAATSTTSVTLPTCSLMSTRWRSPETTLVFAVAFLKLGASAVTVYCPDGSRLTTKSPEPVVVTVLVSLVAVLVTVILTFGTTAPAWSVTVPRMSAVLS